MARHCHKLRCPKYKTYLVISLHKLSHGSQPPWSCSSFAALRNAGCTLPITPQPFHLLPFHQLHKWSKVLRLTYSLASLPIDVSIFLPLPPYHSFLSFSIPSGVDPSSRSSFLTTSLQARELPGWLSGLGTPWPASTLNFYLSQHLWASHRSSFGSPHYSRHSDSPPRVH